MTFYDNSNNSTVLQINLFENNYLYLNYYNIYIISFKVNLSYTLSN